MVDTTAQRHRKAPTSNHRKKLMSIVSTVKIIYMYILQKGALSMNFSTSLKVRHVNVYY